MEEVDKVMTNLKSQEKININTWKKLTKYRAFCVYCRKEFEFEAIPASKWDIPKRYFCSDECKAVWKEKEYCKRLIIIPKKFRDIKCDKADLIKQGIDQSLFITGASGVGKTVLMAGVVKELLKDT